MLLLILITSGLYKKQQIWEQIGQHTYGHNLCDVGKYETTSKVMKIDIKIIERNYVDLITSVCCPQQLKGHPWIPFYRLWWDDKLSMNCDECSISSNHQICIGNLYIQDGDDPKNVLQ